MQFSLQMLHDPEAWEVSPCMVRVFRALNVALREIVKKKKNLKNPDGNGNCCLSLATVHFFGDFYSEIYTHRYISMKFIWKWCKGNYFSYKIHLMIRYICLHEHKTFQYNRINFFFSFNLEIFGTSRKVFQLYHHLCTLMLFAIHNFRRHFDFF